jgi:hypothetical protein
MSVKSHIQTDNPFVAKVDLHLHSYASNETDYYTAQTFKIPESYSNLGFGSVGLQRDLVFRKPCKYNRLRG